MKKILIIPLLILIGLETHVFAQQDPMFTQFMYNKLAFNPGYAGSRDIFSGDILYRRQWIGFPGAPNTLSVSLHTPLQNPHVALGLTAYNDQIGLSDISGALGTFAYRLLLSRSVLSFGLQGGVKYSTLKWSELSETQKNDPTFDPAAFPNQVIPDVNFGIYWYSNDFYLGVASKHLIEGNFLTKIDENTGEKEMLKLAAHLYTMAGMAISLSDNLVLRPALFTKFVKNAPPQFEINGTLVINKDFGIGLSYRTVKSISVLAEVNLSPKLRLGYSYDIWLNDLLKNNQGSHEIRLGFDLEYPKNRLRNSRYF